MDKCFNCGSTNYKIEYQLVCFMFENNPKTTQCSGYLCNDCGYFRARVN